jgi:S-adenosylmethionine/arginine decarboxylase-like enzyme
MPTSKVVGNKIRVIASIHTPILLPPSYWARLSQHLAGLVGLTTLRSDIQRYEPQGATIMTYLAESHVIVTTYPEDQHAEFEVVSCKDFDAEYLIGSLAIRLHVHDALVQNWTLFRKNEDHEWRPC